MGSDLRKRGPNFITYSPEFEKKICIQNKQKPLTFRFDSHIGKVSEAFWHTRV